MNVESTNPIWPLRWHPLPDPRDTDAIPRECIVTFSRHSFEHWIERHVSQQDEPWDTIFGNELVETLRVTRPYSQLYRDLSLESETQMVEWLQSQFRRSLARPLVMLFLPDLKKKPNEPLTEYWQAVLPLGAIAALSAKGLPIEVRTCFIPTYVARKSSRGNAWMDVVRHLVTVGTRLKDGVRRHPLSHEEFIVSAAEQPLRKRRGVRFVLPAHWGFRHVPGSELEYHGKIPLWLEERLGSEPMRSPLSKVNPERYGRREP